MNRAIELMAEFEPDLSRVNSHQRQGVIMILGVLVEVENAEREGVKVSEHLKQVIREYLSRD
ncbi:hypothetical protein BW866_004860 [Salmonella enterica subsp. enterica serovar Weltevreden]|nr:hypothetical protein [Salmonella enterica subsp. enterica serovar Weltevreden]